MDKIIAFCGLNCAECGGFLATQANDEDWKERIAAEWREIYQVPDITVASITCDGCLSKNSRLGGYCTECGIRACGVERGITNCASCPDYPCDQLENFFSSVPQARQNLDQIRGVSI